MPGFPLRPRRGARLGSGLGCAALVLIALAAPASAHVTVNPSTATQGGYAALTFRVPTEVDDASTVKVQVYFPPEQPLASVSVKPHPGWSYRVTTSRLPQPVKTPDGTLTSAVSRITWTPDSPADAIKPGEFDEFEVSGGPLPDAPSMEFKALQTYSDGNVVRWIESPTAGAAEPEHPAPVLTLTPAGSGATGQGAGGTATPAAHEGHDTTALVLSIVALVVALAAAAAALLRRPAR